MMCSSAHALLEHQLTANRARLALITARFFMLEVYWCSRVNIPNLIILECCVRNQNKKSLKSSALFDFQLPLK